MTTSIPATKSEAFERLVRLRRIVVRVLSYFMLTLLAINVALMSFWAPLAARPVFDNGIVTIGIAFSVGVIFAGALVSIGYTIWANKTLDALVAQAQIDLAKTQAHDHAAR